MLRTLHASCTSTREPTNALRMPREAGGMEFSRSTGVLRGPGNACLFAVEGVPAILRITLGRHLANPTERSRS